MHSHWIELYTKTLIADIAGIFVLSPDAVGLGILKVLVSISSVGCRHSYWNKLYTKTLVAHIVGIF